MKRIAIIGGGAAGFFSAINLAEKNPNMVITIFEQGKSVLDKVKISGGGRCNVTNAVFDVKELIKNYPRGEKSLISPFHRFNCKDTVAWFESRGVELKTEGDKRIFPVTDNSQTIINCLTGSAKKAGVKVLTHTSIQSFTQSENNKWNISTKNGDEIFDALLIASGSNYKIWDRLKKLGHNIIPPVPSLFTFNIKDERISGLAGIALKNVSIKIKETNLSASGPLLITHWGLSGPAVLKLSAWGARILNEMKYEFTITINFTGRLNAEQAGEKLSDAKYVSPKKNISASNLFNIPVRFWERLVKSYGILPELKWKDISKKQIVLLAEELSASNFQVNGKSTFKEEFVTAGGVDLNEVNFKTMESKLFKNLYFAGEVLDIDAVTGGFNFQAAWTTAFIAAEAIAFENSIWDIKR